ncbi:hypothetical protein E3N88_06499 [Mikania micrantha]|uniref:Uncharacterized protein n=1 Tax=Mikania micrantha TaxID=192012 RepID=A0A5N6PNW9_9ASTR|nr:hypothetical protein E3N88_06499 [Mikania micrantha]
MLLALRLRLARPRSRNFGNRSRSRLRNRRRFNNRGKITGVVAGGTETVGGALTGAVTGVETGCLVGEGVGLEGEAAGVVTVVDWGGNPKVRRKKGVI